MTKLSYSIINGPILIVCISLSLLFCSCESSPGSVTEVLQGNIQIQLNPFKVVPLGALLNFNTQEACRVDIKVEGEIPVERSFPTFNTDHSIPVLDLHPDTLNTVVVTLTTKSGASYAGEYYIATNPLPGFLPDNRPSGPTRKF